ncbi:MAG: hypothetical protein JRG89_22815, partial [Deltaproteobacteria bacterium]|nr:hypothetical protein [Deltaproteobacteria bacterium]
LVLVALPLLVRRLRAGEEAAPNGAAAPNGEKDSRLEIARFSLLLFLAFSSYASYYDFFRASTGVGFKDTDVYHYYMGSKYFSEVGYFDLYHCTVRALIDSGVESSFELPRVRDQRTLRIHTPETALAAANQCRRQFSDDRWQQFTSDVTWFEEKFQGNPWHAILFDHGYNPSPVWNAIGGAITSRVPLQSAAFDWLIYSDRVMLVASFLLIGWAFGLEVAALSVIVWGTGQHWGYSWIGDSLLRNLWLFGVIAGLCFVKRSKNLLGGAFLSFASLLRVFPAIFIVGFALRSWLGMRRKEEWRPAAQGFAIGVLSTGVVLLLWAALASEWGAFAYLEFWEKISVFSDQRSLNKLGLSSLIWRTIMLLTGHLVTGPEGNSILTPYAMPWLPLMIRLGQLAVVVPAALLFWRALSHARTWEAAALGFALIPLLSDPANYYFSFVICGAMLAGGRPRLQVYLMAGAVLWLANGLWFYRVPEEYLGAGIVAVLLPLAVLYEMSRENLTPAPSHH